jgi:uncharacterized protein YqfA (UPF0365 family)
VDNNFVILMFFALAATLFVLLPLLVLFASVGRHWLRATTSGAPITLISVIGMRLRGSPPALVIDAYITLKRSGSPATISDVEGMYIDNRTRVRSSTDLVELVNNRLQSDRPSKST